MLELGVVGDQVIGEEFPNMPPTYLKHVSDKRPQTGTCLTDFLHHDLVTAHVRRDGVESANGINDAIELLVGHDLILKLDKEGSTTISEGALPTSGTCSGLLRSVRPPALGG